MSASAWSEKDILGFLGCKRRQEQASCWTPAGIKMFIWITCWCCRYRDELRHTVCMMSHPKQPRTGNNWELPHEICPDKAVSGAMQSRWGSCIIHHFREASLTHTTNSQEPAPLQKLTWDRNSHTEKLLNRAHGVQAAHKVWFGFLRFILFFFFFWRNLI